MFLVTDEPIKAWQWMLCLVAGLVACSPALNWRLVQPVDGLELLLPCKPSQRREPVTLGAQQTELSMMGCRAQDMDFTHSVMSLPPGMDVQELMTQWQRASVSPLGPHQSQPLKPRAIAGLAQPATAVRVTAQSGVQAQFLWWHRGQQMHQLAVYGPKSGPPFEQAVDAFISSVKHTH